MEWVKHCELILLLQRLTDIIDCRANAQGRVVVENESRFSRILIPK